MWDYPTLTNIPPRDRIAASKEIGMSVKLTDSKGRVTLGPQFANRTVIIEEVDETEVRVIAAAVVPQREIGSSQSKAKASVLRGLEQGMRGKLSKSPDLSKGARLIEQMDD